MQLDVWCKCEFCGSAKEEFLVHADMRYICEKCRIRFKNIIEDARA